jgi:hypothetical protein
MYFPKTYDDAAQCDRAKEFFDCSLSNLVKLNFVSNARQIN